MAKRALTEFEQAAFDKLKVHGLRITTPRKAIIACLANASHPLSAYRIKELLDETPAPADVVSIYRTLATLDALGLIHRVHSSDGFLPCTVGVHTEPATEHAICDNCGKVVELAISPQTTSDIQQQVGMIGFRLRHLRVEIEGECEVCQENTPS